MILSPAPDALATLRDRLLVLRDDLRGRLAAADALDAGMLRMLGEVGAALAALDGEAVGAELATRAVVSDGGEIRLVLYGAAGAVAATVLDPVRAIHLAGRLIAVALAGLDRA
jgi:hypothetical protein